MRQQNQAQQVDLYRPIVSAGRARPPLVIRVGVQNEQSISEGVPSGPPRQEAYVLLSAMPEELRRRIELAVQAVMTSV